MALVDLELSPDGAALPERANRFIAAANHRITTFGASRPAFIPSDPELVYAALFELRRSDLLTGSRFCEWGSGLGVIAGLAAMLDYDAHAIEIESDLVEAGEALCAEFDLDVEQVAGTFVPDASQDLVAGAGDELDWLQPGGADAYELFGRDPEEFDLVFAYPWPGEEEVIEQLFDRHAGSGAVLLTFHGLEGLRARRAVS
ncbi:MAG: hypothetical protein ACYS0E_12195 [Planctomycetota bacterium]|jgi:hypothetical protein